jgi:hypothetical protein
MALPKLNVPRYKIKLPSDGRTVSFRPFLVKEEKLLLLATETGEQDDIVTAIKNIIKECTDIQNVERLSTFDIEYVFLQIRTKSVGESVDVTVICPDDGETEVAISIPLDDIKVVKTRGHKREMKLSDEIVITMGYPSLDTFVKMNFTDSDSEVEQVYECKDVPKAELIEWFNELNSKQFQMIQKFFETMPKLSHTVMVTNPNTGVESEVVLEGLASFFA